ncbi:MAG: hypothetical protein A2086_00930 [Spirochaetes bacterium GWD1_27_9]|nr:MAG: hypothetical protein A2Z98_03865 [Spirochaetes bacterium GWB1_27_13]OHD24217.1 MAG: hypothetical protein A2Y34_02550 [Spirochaetes bacterium GWC1_27_15]OHD33616.1 MAG: hypothetical protein A2086_00930 [Spirochaetes bacterium GWD1_27_9]
MVKGYELPKNFLQEIDDLIGLINKNLSGEMDGATLKSYRVPFGIYEQRTPDTFMVRIRCTGGIITPSQFLEIAKISQKFGEGKIHITTRQEVQLHDIKLKDIPFILKELYGFGLSTRGGGGNTIRNVVVSVNSGIDKNEVFDIVPYAVSLVTKFLEENDSFGLPRKLKFAFVNSTDDLESAILADLGFVAKIKDNKKGFKVFISGGMGAKYATGKLLFDFIDDTELYNVAKTVKNIFNQFGDRKNRHKSRLRFLFDKLGEKEFFSVFDKEYQKIKIEQNYILPITPIENKQQKFALIKEENNTKEYSLWQSSFVFQQKQQDLYSILLPIKLGDIKASDVIKLSDFLDNFGENTIRFTKEQNIQIRNIHKEYLANFYNFLTKTFEAYSIPLSDTLVSCTGADTCKLGIGLSKNLSSEILKLINQELSHIPYNKKPKINISGCPNCCGKHWVGDLGFYGFVAKKGENIYLAYNIVCGFTIKCDNLIFSTKIGEIGAKKLPLLLNEFFNDYLKVFANYESFYEYFNMTGKELLIKLLNEKYKTIPFFEEDKTFYCDWGSDEIFSLIGKGSGECSAGLFDFIEKDIKIIEKIKLDIENESNEEKINSYLHQIIFTALRMILLTKGIETNDKQVVFNAFTKNFINTGIIDKSYQDLIYNAEKLVNLNNNKQKTFALVTDIITHYKSIS